MRIVITSNYTVGNETGTAHVSEELSKYLSKKHQVVYICVGEKYRIKKINNNYTLIEIPSIKINKIEIPFITPIVMLDTFSFLEKFKPNIYHAQNPFLISNMAQLFANTQNVPFVVTFHHIPTEAVEHVLPKFSKNIFVQTVQEIYKEIGLKKFLNRTDGVVALNQRINNSIRKMNKTISIQIINNGLDLQGLLKIKTRNNNTNQVNFVSLGSYTERKNQKYLIKVFSFLPANYVLKFYGNKKTGGKYLKELAEMIKNLKLKNVFLEDYSKEVIKILEWSDYFITASTKEAQSLAIIQAFASARPVIGLKNETISELINPKNGLGLPLQTSPKSFAKKLLVFSKKDNYKTIANNARKDSKKFDIKSVSPKIEKYYKQLLLSRSL